MEMHMRMLQSDAGFAKFAPEVISGALVLIQGSFCNPPDFMHIWQGG